MSEDAQDPNDMKSVSPKKREANRRNAENSTGPRTARGKSRSKLNAVKRNIFAKNILAALTKEDAKEYNWILRELWLHYGPANVMEELLVKKIAEALWRGVQTQKWESVLLDRLETSAKEAQQNIISTVTIPNDLERLVDYGNRFRSREEKLIQELERRQKERRMSAGSESLEGS